MGAWSFATLPATGANVAVDIVGGLDIQAVKIDAGAIGASQPVTSGNGMPTQVDDMILRRIARLLEASGTQDGKQRQRICVDAIGTADLSGASSVPINIVSGTVTTVSLVTAQTALAGMDREMWINAARTAYATGIRAKLN